MVSARRRRTSTHKSDPADDRSTRADALRRFAAEVSGRQDLDGLFRDVIDESFTLFGVDEAGLWTYDDSPTPLTLAAQRGLTREVLEIIATLPRDAPTLGMNAMRAQEVRIMRGDLGQTIPSVQAIYRRAGIRTSASPRSCSTASRSGCSCCITTATTRGQPMKLSWPGRLPTTWPRP